MSRTEQFLLGAARSRTALQIGLVNNMPDAAMRATELQFARLLKEASGSHDVRLRLFSLSAIARGAQARARMEGFYDDADFLHSANIDALIVTGAEPRCPDLRDESYWPQLAHLIDWAEIGTVSTLFSCLAAHAAVLHLDGIARRPLARKLSGIFESHRAEDDALFFNLAPNVPVPHSRRNDVAAADLGAKGYRVLSRLTDGSADIFSRQRPGHSHFLFFQGHPEYDVGTLGREYLRDMNRFWRDELASPPMLPQNYFDRATEDRLSELAGGRDAVRLGEIVTTALPRQAWRGHTVRLFANWLTLVAAAKARRESSAEVPTRRRAASAR